jgi:hypothetical protein
MSSIQSTPTSEASHLRTGWPSRLARACFAALLFETLTGLAVTLAPFHPAVQWGVLLHTAVGALTLLPVAWYCGWHVADYRRHAWSHITLLGWVAVASLAVVSVSGGVLTVQAVFGINLAYSGVKYVNRFPPTTAFSTARPESRR